MFLLVLFEFVKTISLAVLIICLTAVWTWYILAVGNLNNSGGVRAYGVQRLCLLLLPWPLVFSVPHLYPSPLSLANYLSAAVFIISFTKVFELWGCTVQPIVLSSGRARFADFCMYFLTPGRIILPQTNQTLPSAWKPALGKLLSAAAFLCAVWALGSWMPEHLPFLAEERYKPLNDLRRMYLVFAFAMFFTRPFEALLLLTRYRLRPGFNHPYVASSPYDFWSRRHNLHMSGFMHRSVFGPLRAVGLDARVAGLTTFAYSGLIHEYTVWAAAQSVNRPNLPPRTGFRQSFRLDWPYPHAGSQLCFFVLHGVLVFLQLAWQKRHRNNVQTKKAKLAADWPGWCLKRVGSVLLFQLCFSLLAFLFVDPLVGLGVLEAPKL